MATTYASQFYTSGGVIIVPPSWAMIGALKGDSVVTTIATTVTNGTNTKYLIPLPATGLAKLLGFWLNCGDLDSNGSPLLDADIVWLYTIGGVLQTPVVLYDSSVSGLFSAAITDKWVDCARRKLEIGDDGVGHLAFLVNVAGATPASGSLNVRPQWI